MDLYQVIKLELGANGNEKKDNEVTPGTPEDGPDYHNCPDEGCDNTLG